MGILLVGKLLQVSLLVLRFRKFPFNLFSTLLLKKFHFIFTTRVTRYSNVLKMAVSGTCCPNIVINNVLFHFPKYFVLDNSHVIILSEPSVLLPITELIALHSNWFIPV